MRALVITGFVALFANLAAGEDSAEEASLIDKVISGVRENDLRLGPIKARLRMVIDPPYRREAGPAAERPAPPEPQPKRAGVPIDSSSRLRVDTNPVNVIEWTAEIAGENRRFEVSGPHGKSIFSLDQTGITHHDPQLKNALITPWSDQKSFHGHTQYDPREIGLLTLAENLLRLRAWQHRVGEEN